jgi:hypothetical protein
MPPGSGEGSEEITVVTTALSKFYSAHLLLWGEEGATRESQSSIAASYHGAEAAGGDDTIAWLTMAVAPE